MSKVENGVVAATPKSKYAAKREARVKAVANANEEQKVIEMLPENDEQEVQTTNDEQEVHEENNHIVLQKTDNIKSKRPFIKGATKNLAKAFDNYPKEQVDLAIIILQNAEIRRFTALGILNYLTQKGEINGNSKYVSFQYDKFAVKIDGLSREFRYTEKFFINCLLAAFTSFANSAAKTINAFINKEIKDYNQQDNVDEINSIIEANNNR